MKRSNYSSTLRPTCPLQIISMVVNDQDLQFSSSDLFHRNPSYIMRRFVFKDSLDNVKRFRVINSMLVPPQVIAIVNFSKEQIEYAKTCLKSVVAVVGGAAPLDRHYQQTLQDLLPKGLVFTQLWAMTETSCIAS